MARSHIVLIAMIFMAVLAIGSVSAAAPEKSADAASAPVGQAVAAPGTDDATSSDDGSIGEDASAAEDGAMGPAIATSFGEGPASAVSPGPASSASGLKVSAAVAATAAASAFFFF